MITFRGPCRRYRAVLIDYVDHGERGPRSEAALEHMARCASCRSELERAALTIRALRQLSGDVAGAEPSADAWSRLRARLQRARRLSGWSPPMQVGSLVASTWVVALLAGSGLVISPAGGVARTRLVETPAATQQERVVRGAGDRLPPAEAATGPQRGAESATTPRWISPDGNAAASRRDVPGVGRQVPRK